MFLQARNLKVHFPTEDGIVRAVDGLDFSLERGKTLAIVGESGSGKTATSLAVLGLHGPRANISGEILLDGQQIVGADEKTLGRLRGERMAMIFQDPLTAMHPYYRVGDQIAESFRAHRKVNAAAARTRALEMLDRVGMADPKRCFASYPHELSGGMRQRAMIAMALVCDPDLLIADEPTTALDVTIQAQIVELLAGLQREFNSAIVLITHDLGLVAELADDVVVMYGGQAVETGSVRDIFYRPTHPYSWGLLGSVPRLDLPRDRLNAIPGAPPSLSRLPAGCVFAPRCDYTSLAGEGLCAGTKPALNALGDGRAARCHLGAAQAETLWRSQAAGTRSTTTGGTP